MISEAKFFGGSRYVSSGSDITVYAGYARVNSISMTASGKKVKAEDARRIHQPGGPIYYLVNVGANAFDFADFGGNVVIAVPTNSVCTALLTDNSTANGAWVARVKTRVV